MIEALFRDIDERWRATHDRLIERFKAAVDHYEMDARAEDLPQYVENLHAVERHMLVVPVTNIELPPWISA